MDNIDELVIDVALAYNGRKGYYTGRNIAKEMDAIAESEKQIVKQNEKIAKSQEKIAKTGFQLGKALKTLGLYLGFREIVRYADEWQRVSNILQRVTKTDKERIALQEKLYQIGRRTRTTTASTADIYMSLGAAGLSEKQQLNATEVLQKLFKSSGSKGRAVESIKRMLRTGKLASLIGIDQNMAEIIASGMGMNIEELQRKIKKGGLTSLQVLQALSNKSQDINKNFSKTKTTLSEAFTGLKESGVKFFGTLEDKLGVFSKFANAINILSGWIEVLADNFMKLIKIIGVGFLGVVLTNTIRSFNLFMGLVIDKGVPAMKAFSKVMSGTFLVKFAKGLKILAVPLLKVYLLLEAINQVILLIKGEETIFHKLGKMGANLLHHGSLGEETYEHRIERLKGDTMNKYGRIITPEEASQIWQARMPNVPIGHSQNKEVNINNTITVNESRNGLATADNLLETTLRRATDGGF